MWDRNRAGQSVRSHGLSLMALAASVCAAPAVAQDRPDEDSGQKEIVVTARKRVENVQDVPDSVRVLTGDTLVATGVRDVSGYCSSSPT